MQLRCSGQFLASHHNGEGTAQSNMQLTKLGQKVWLSFTE